MDNILKLSPKTIIEHLTLCDDMADAHAKTNQSLPTGNRATFVDDINWVLARWPATSVPLRTLSDEQHQSLKRLIKQVPTGKQKHYQHALNAIIIYLHDVAKWQLPARTKRLFIDHDLAWFARLNEQAEFVYQLGQGYQRAQSAFLQTRAQPCAAEAALMIAMEAAPLSLNTLASVLSQSESIELAGQQTTLKVMHSQRPHSSALQTAPAFTRYHLTLYSYRFLALFYQAEVGFKTPLQPLTVKQLLTSLNEHIAKAPYHLPARSAAQWHAVFQAIWRYSDEVPPTLLKDMAQPERHVDFDMASPSAARKNRALKAIYQQDWLTSEKLALIKPTSKPRWPQRQLITHWVKGGDVEAFPTPVLRPYNILEHYLFLYCRDLILYGGVQVKDPSKATVTKYCNIEVCFNDEPLLYAVAIDQDQLQQWAKRVYEKQESETHKGLVRYFFRFLTTQALTDHLDINEFESPSLAPTVDPYRIPLTALHEIIDALLTQPQGDILQRFYCAVSAILGYFGCLRRGEILRLRIKDIHNSALYLTVFHLTVTKTEEGEPKNRKTRTVHAVIPEALAKLVRIAINLKNASHYNTPLIGFDGEKANSRQLNYLLPVTKALKAVCGQAARVHHLRKSGIQLFMHQGLQLVYQHLDHELGKHADLASQLTEEIVAQRFSYWIEDREPKEINDGLLFDEICREIGHAHYATTRWSYLHGAQWLFPYLRPQHSSSAQQAFSHAKLRFLLDLSPDSNDLSRQLMLISEDYKNSTVSEKQMNPVMLTESSLRTFLWQEKTNHQLVNKANAAFKDPNYYYKRWVTSASIRQNKFVDTLFINMLKAQSLDWVALSAIWRDAAKHAHSPLNKKQRTALSYLGKIALIPAASDLIDNVEGTDKNLPFMKIQIASNAKNATNFETVFRQPEWQWLTCSFELTVNRKTKVDRLLDLVETHYTKGKEKISVIRQPQGSSLLTITLTPKFPVSDFVMEQTLKYLNSQEKNTHG